MNSSPNAGPSDRLAQISHQLRTPLTVIMATVNNLLDGAFGKLNGDQEKWLKKLSGHTGTLESLLNEIIEQIKAGHINPTLGAQIVKNASPAPSLDSLFDWKRSPKILVVDDEPDILETVQQALSMKGLESHTCSNGTDAIEKARSLKPDLILMDANLGPHNGIEICRTIKSEHSSYTPVLLITGQEDLAKKMNFEKNDPDDFLIKPFQIAELLSRVTSLLRTKKLYEELAKEKAA
jgi:PleD family two-component response regulator